MLLLVFFISALITYYTYHVYSYFANKTFEDDEELETLDSLDIDNDFGDDSVDSIDSNISTSSEPDCIVEKFVSDHDRQVSSPYIIGIAGASGSGKSYVAKIIAKTIKRMFPEMANDIEIISQDSYYKGGNENTNYDVPESIDFDLMCEQLYMLINNKQISSPIYDFVTHTRKDETKIINPCKILIVEGILIFTQERLRNMLDMKIFIDAAIPTQIFRRVSRDTTERGRTIDDVWRRYEQDVWPSFKTFVSPSAEYADVVINNFYGCFVGPQIVLSYIINVAKNISKSKH